MRIENPPPLRKPLPLTPLVDVVFLLLMFFMLSSTFTKFGDLDMRRRGAEPSAAPGEASPQAGTPGVIISVSKGPHIRVNGHEIAIDELASTLDGYYLNGVRSGGVMLSSSAEVQDLVSVLERARTSKLKAIAVLR